jgi:hypothetical protein
LDQSKHPILIEVPSRKYASAQLRSSNWPLCCCRSHIDAGRC